MKSPLYKTIKECRICGSAQIATFLELGVQPPANSLRSNLSEELPLVSLSLCRCPECTTVQLTETVDPNHLFRHYFWVTGTSSTAKEYAAFFFKEAAKRIDRKNGFVVEIASNDGTFLKLFKDNGFTVLGVDPAENIAKIAIEKGIPTEVDFFGAEQAKKIVPRKGKADFIFARNVIPHVANVHDVIEGVKACLNDGGVGAIEFHYAGEIIKGLQYDSIYHEHLFYFSLKSMEYLLERHGFAAFDLMESPISGGSLVIYFTHESNKRAIKKGLKQKLEEEIDLALDSEETWGKFSNDCFTHKQKLISLIKEMAGSKLLIGYGASARSSTMLNFCGIDSSYLKCIADQNPLKHNKFTAGTDIPIVSPEEAFAKNPDVVVLLAWNFRSEIMALLRNKFKFKKTVIVPLPNKPEVLII